uniref:Calcium voltage-gated channel subunit alpha1 I n=1 Tax=Paramormyrops kingsleyae TaxID=1676925 RepID=A0A3B3RH03_9TELE
MMSEECPGALGMARVRTGPCEDQGEESAKEAGPGDDISEDLSTLVVPFPELAPVVFFCLKQTTCPRSWCIRLVSSPYPLCIMVILLNCVTLGMYQPCENIDCSSDRCQVLQAFDAFIYIFFALEMVIKMVALGIFGQRCYMGDTWNRLDFFIVMAGMVEYSLDLQNINLSAIRTVRVLRPLKAINRVPSESPPPHPQPGTLSFHGSLKLRGTGLSPSYNLICTSGLTLPTPYYQPEEDDERPFICSLAADNGIMSCQDVPARREGGRECCLDKEDVLRRQALGLAPEPLVNGSVSVAGLCVNWNQYYTRCQTGHSNPHKGAINFDNIGYAWIVIFQVITLEGWVEIMYYVMDAHSFYNFIYFIFLIIIGSFFMINLCLVVIATQFSETKQREHQLMQEQRARCLSSSTLASMAEPGDCYEEMFQYVCHVLRKARRRSAALYNTLRGRSQPPGGSRARAGRPEAGTSINGGDRHYHPQQSEWIVGVRDGLSRCPRHSKPENSAGPTGSPTALSVMPVTEDCPDCRMALSVREATGALAVSANEEEEEDRAMEETDGYSNHLEEDEGADEGVEHKADRRKRTSCWGWCRALGSHMRVNLRSIVESKYFNRGIMIAILINTISMGIEHHDQPDELTNVLEISNIVFTSMFTLEMILKLTAFGFFSYLRNPYNIFDGIIVIISVCEIVGQADGGLSVLRTFRLLRVIKLVRFMPALRRQLVVLMKTMDNVATFCMLLMLFIFIFSILGMHIFGCKFSLKTEAGDTIPDRKNFDSLLWAIVTVFQILTQEDWNMVLYNGMASTSPWAALYFVALMTFGNYVLFNLLVAILVEGFQAEVRPCSGHSSLYHNWARPHPHSVWTRRSSWNSLGRSSRGMGGSSLRARGPHSIPVEHESLLSPPLPPLPLPPPPPSLSRRFAPCRDRRALSLELPELLQVPAVLPLNPLAHKRSLLGAVSGPGLPGEHQDCNGRAPSPTPQLLGEVYPQVSTRAEREELDEEIDYSLCFRVQKMMEVYRPDWCEAREDWSVYLFSPRNKFRLLCQSVIAHKLFDYVVLGIIFSNCITVALERPKIHQGSLERLLLTISNYIFTIIFVGEMTLKVVSMGLYLGEQAYLRSSWNVLDCFLVFVSLVDIVVSMAGGAKILGVLRVLRLLRTLRPLRVISRAPGLKLVVETLITSLKPIGNIVLICCAFFIIFGILGVQLFKGKFFYCLGPDVKNITNKSDCLLVNYKWVHHKYNFDNLGQALMSLFVLASKDGWVNIMYHGLDAVGIDQQPVINNNPWMLLYFISFLLIVSFFVLNMFVGVVVENFHKCRQHQEVEEARRREEKRLRRMEKKRRKAQKLPYYANYSHTRLMIHSLCTSHYLDLFITFIICVNVVTMSLEHYSQPHSLEIGLKYCNYFFTTTFVLEAVLKLIAFGFRRFFKDRWNQLDLAIVLLSVMGITLEEIEISAALPINPTIIRIMRVLRIARVLKLLKMATGMRALLDTVVQALPQVHWRVRDSWLLLIPLKNVWGETHLFAALSAVCNEDYPCEGMSRHATFENFGMAFLTLFQVSTGDNWNGIMKDTLRECPSSEYNCNASLQFISPMYFVSFVLTAQFVLINVVVAVLMKHLDDSNKEAQEDAEMDAEIEMELAQGTLCCMGGQAGVRGGGASRGGGQGGGGQTGLLLPLDYAESLWLDSVSLLIKDSLEGELLMIDNLSGSVFHHYASPPVCKDCRRHPQEIRLAEVEQVSLRSEQLSDKSSSPALPDNLSLDEHSVFQLLVRDSRVGPREPMAARRINGSSCSCSPPEIKLGLNVRQETSRGAPAVLTGFLGLSPVPRCKQWATEHTGERRVTTAGTSGASDRGVTSHPSVLFCLFSFCLQYPSHSDSSLATGSSEGSLQTTLEEGLSFSISPPQDITMPLPRISPLPDDPNCSPGEPQSPLVHHSVDTPVVINLQDTRGHQRSQSSCGESNSPGRERKDSIDPSDEDLGIGIGGGGSSQACYSEHLSETLSSLSLTSLLSPSSLAPQLGKKCNSTGSLDQGNLSARGREVRVLSGSDAHGYLSSPWTGEKGGRAGEGDMAEFDVRSTNQNTVAASRKKR